MVLPLNLFQAIAQGVQEVVVGRDDRSIRLEVNHRLGTTDRLNFRPLIGNLRLGLGSFDNLSGDVGGVLDHASDFFRPARG